MRSREWTIAPRDVVPTPSKRRRRLRGRGRNKGRTTANLPTRTSPRLPPAGHPTKYPADRRDRRQRRTRTRSPVTPRRSPIKRTVGAEGKKKQTCFVSSFG